MALLPLEDDEADRLLADVPTDVRGQRWWLVLRDGTPVAGDGGGGVALLTEMQLTRPLGRVLGALHADPLVDAVDKLAASNRDRLAHVVPEGPAPRTYP